MRLYLSSFRLGDSADELPALYRGGPVGHISNAIDGAQDSEWRREWAERDVARLRALGLDVRAVDLSRFFDDTRGLKEAISACSGLWVTGGNVFVLRQAMKLSGLDSILMEDELPADFVYGGYSAGCCVLSPTLIAYAAVDDPTQQPYGTTETIWEGLSLLDFVFMPHFQSDHPESSAIDRAIAVCAEKRFSYKTFRDGEVHLLGAP